MVLGVVEPDADAATVAADAAASPALSGNEAAVRNPAAEKMGVNKGVASEARRLSLASSDMES